MYQLPKDISQATPNVFNSSCPARCLLEMISGKWNLLIIDALAQKRWRNGELKRKIDGISQKMLTQTLRELENMNLVRRIDMGTIPPHVEYELTPLGHDLKNQICALDRWIEANMLKMIKDNQSIKVDYI